MFDLEITFLGLLTSTLFYGYCIDKGYIYNRKEEKITLTPRTLKQDVCNVNKSSNRFAKEFDLLILSLGHIPDYCACKVIDPAVLPVLVEQEYNHARMHNKQKPVEYERFRIIRKIYDFGMLRCGMTMSMLTLCAFETVNSSVFYTYITQNIIENVFCDALLFHFLEEIEHGCVTVSYLRPRTNWIFRLVLSFPIYFMLFFTFLYPICSRIVYNPMDLVDLRMYIELVKYVFVVCISMFSGIRDLLLFYASPGIYQGEDKKMRDYRLDNMLKKTQHIEFNLGTSADYPVMMI
jgi:hypothetical protein